MTDAPPKPPSVHPLQLAFPGPRCCADGLWNRPPRRFAQLQPARPHIGARRGHSTAFVDSPHPTMQLELLHEAVGSPSGGRFRPTLTPPSSSTFRNGQLHWLHLGLGEGLENLVGRWHLSGQHWITLLTQRTHMDAPADSCCPSMPRGVSGRRREPTCHFGACPLHPCASRPPQSVLRDAPLPSEVPRACIHIIECALEVIHRAVLAMLGHPPRDQVKANAAVAAPSF